MTTVEFKDALASANNRVLAEGVVLLASLMPALWHAHSNRWVAAILGLQSLASVAMISVLRLRRERVCREWEASSLVRLVSCGLI